MTTTSNRPLASKLFNYLLATLLLFLSSATVATDKNILKILTWSDYMDPELVTAFEQQHDATIKFVYFDDDDARDTILINSGSGEFDLVLSSGRKVINYLNKGWLEPISIFDVPNLKLIERRWLDAFEGANGYAVPYFWGTLGIAYRRDLVSTPITSWNDFFRPSAELQGKIVVMSSVSDTIGMALKALGYSANSVNRRALNEAEQLLQEQKPHTKTYSYIAITEDSPLVTGELVASMVFNGDALMLREHNENIEFVLPKEGSNLWVDYFTVMRHAANKPLAMAFLDFINQPEHAAKQAQYLYYASPNMAAIRLLPEEFLNNPIIYPPMEELTRSEFYQRLPPRALRQRNRIMSELIK